MSILGWSFNDNIEIGSVSLSFYMNYFVVSLLLLVGAFVLVRRLERSWIGLNLDALRLDETAASCFGLDIARWKITAFLIGNFLIGIAGALFGMVGGFVAPNNYTFADSLILVSILLLGGIGNPWGLIVATDHRRGRAGEAADDPGIPVPALCADGDRGAAVPPRRTAAAAGAPLFPGMAAMSALLEARGLSKHFGGVLALDELDLAVAAERNSRPDRPERLRQDHVFQRHHRHLSAPTPDSVTFDGADVTNASARAVYQAGMARTFQRSRLSLPLSIFDNIMIGNHKRLNQGLWFNLVRRGDFKREFEESYRGRARAGRGVRAGAGRSPVRAGRRPADDRPPPHRDLPRADQRAQAAAARRAFGRHDARRDGGADE